MSLRMMTKSAGLRALLPVRQQRRMKFCFRIAHLRADKKPMGG